MQRASAGCLPVIFQVRPWGSSAIQATLRALTRLVLVVQVLGDIKGGENVLIAQLLLLSASQQTPNLEDVLDLTAIHVDASKLGELSLCNRMLLRGVIQEVAPDGLARFD